VKYQNDAGNVPVTFVKPLRDEHSDKFQRISKATAKPICFIQKIDCGHPVVDFFNF
jgi:hypothetical protein